MLRKNSGQRFLSESVVAALVFCLVFAIGNVAISAGSESGKSPDTPDTPDIKTWVNQVNTKIKSKTRKGGVTGLMQYPIRVAFVDDTYSKSPKFLEFDLESFNRLGLYHAVQSTDLSWSWKLNDFEVKKKGRKSTTNGPISEPTLPGGPEDDDKANKPLDLNTLLKLFDADVYVNASSDQSKEWVAFRIANNEQEIISKEKAPTSYNVEVLYRWLAKAFGYDGVILDKQGDYLLVGSATLFFKKKSIQALAFKGSHNKFSLRPSEREGMGLLTLVKRSGAYAIFKVLFLGKDAGEIPLNTKVLIEDMGYKKSGTSSFDIKMPGAQ